LCVDVCIVTALLTSCAAGDWKSQEPLNRIQTDSWTEALNELTACYQQPSVTTAAATNSG